MHVIVKCSLIITSLGLLFGLLSGCAAGLLYGVTAGQLAYTGKTVKDAYSIHSKIGKVGTPEAILANARKMVKCPNYAFGNFSLKRPTYEQTISEIEQILQNGYPSVAGAQALKAANCESEPTAEGTSITWICPTPGSTECAAKERLAAKMRELIELENQDVSRAEMAKYVAKERQSLSTR